MHQATVHTWAAVSCQEARGRASRFLYCQLCGGKRTVYLFVLGLMEPLCWFWPLNIKFSPCYLQSRILKGT